MLSSQKSVCPYPGAFGFAMQGASAIINYFLFRFDLLVSCCFTYRKIRGDLCVPTGWSIPHEEPWPLPLRGVYLGRLVNLARQQHDLIKDLYPERFSTLRELGFLWLPPSFLYRNGTEHKEVQKTPSPGGATMGVGLNGY